MYEHPSLSRRRERRGGAEAILHFFRAGLIGRTLKCNPACKYGGVLPQKVRASERKDTFIPDVRGHAKRSLAQTRTCACWSHEHAGAPLRMGVCLRACVCIYMCVCMHTSPRMHMSAWPFSLHFLGTHPLPRGACSERQDANFFNLKSMEKPITTFRQMRIRSQWQSFRIRTSRA